ncbi:unnamed protein product [Alternaria alternata]
MAAMANSATVPIDQEDVPSKRESHFNNQRSSLRSSTISEESAHRPQPRSRTRSDLRRLHDFNLDLEKVTSERADSEPVPDSPTSTASPAPNVPYTSRQRDSSYSSVKRRERHSGKHNSLSTVSSRAGGGQVKSGEDLLAPESWLHLYNENAQSPNLPQPLRTPRTRGPEQAFKSRQQRSRRPSFPLGRAATGSQLDITALPSMSPVQEHDNHNHTQNYDPHAEYYLRFKRTPSAQKASRLATELYTVSYLIFFSIWGTLARLGLQALTFYPGAPVIFSELWANVAGTFIMGFLSEDRRLFAAEWGQHQHGDSRQGEKLPEPSDYPADHTRDKPRHGKVKKTIPMYIGLATGFCGSFTSFSSFIRDIFLSLSNDLKSPHQSSLSPEYSHPFCNYDCIAEWRIQRHGHTRHHHHNNLNVLLCAPHWSSPRASPGPGNAYPALPAHTPRRGPALRGAGLGHMVRRHYHGVLTAALGMALPGPLRPRLCARGMLAPLLCLLAAESYQLVVPARYFYR